MVRFSRRTRAKSCTKNSVQKNCLHDALLGRLVKNKQKNFSKACFPLHLPTLCSALTPHSDLGLWNFALAGSEYGPGQIWIPLLLPPTCVCLPTFSPPPRTIIPCFGFILVTPGLPGLFALSWFHFHTQVISCPCFHANAVFNSLQTVWHWCYSFLDAGDI